MSERDEIKITVTENGPYEVTGGLPLAKQIIEANAEGVSMSWRQDRVYDAGDSYSLCRCGQSESKPFCDGSHEVTAFDGTEVASREPYIDQVEQYDGPEMVLTDAEALCAFARFCDADGQIWNVVEQTDDPAKQAIVKREAGNCPGGRLVAWSKSPLQAIEPDYEPSLGIVEDLQLGVSGPIWARGGIPVIAADGTQYELRNRVALCRCGASSNKPFCDGTHASIRFSDET